MGSAAKKGSWGCCAILPPSRPGQGCSVASLLSGCSTGLRAQRLDGDNDNHMDGWDGPRTGLDAVRTLALGFAAMLGGCLCWASCTAPAPWSHHSWWPAHMHHSAQSVPVSVPVARRLREEQERECVWSVICGVEWLDGLWFLSAVAVLSQDLLISSLVQAESDPLLCALWSAWDPSNADFAIAWTGEANNCPSIRRTPYRSPSSIAAGSRSFFPAAHPIARPC
ncbi:C2H2 transcription factor [Histoplasma capsulatum G186AR]|uniref:C2H2 transcription factor n=1 Tax=Ajellomyces capsulatus TaxID=5037 RepID=A0A8H8D833_AJECA|nr:C2H2 transcription factor [Histoplasma capsulatum]QSS70087.1 C2H2 transcription factor [Histoplasma capsulatum G186AR]